MRFNVASIDHAKTKAKALQKLLDAVGVEAGLTPCQASVARCLGYASWAELKSAHGCTPSPLDEDAGSDVWRARIDRQCRTIEADFDLDPRAAAGIALALRLTSRARSTDTEGDLAAFQPYPRKAVPATVTTGEKFTHDGTKLVPIPQETASLWLMQWEESEAGWGCRPDGYSVHATAEAAKAYVDAYWRRMPDRVPEEYSRPSSDAVEVRLPATHPILDLVSRGCQRIFRHEDVEKHVAMLWPRSAGGYIRMT